MTDFDVVVLGTGASGLVAAISAHDAGARVGLFEKSELVGGTSAMSGGIVWIPDNHHLHEAGLVDSRADGLAYLESLSLGHIDSDMAATFVDTGPEMIRYLEQHTPCRFHVLDGYPDYHPERPGGRIEGGRSLDNALFGFDELGDWAGLVRNHRGANPVMLRETPLGGATELPPADVITERLTAGQNGMGLALVGALLKGCLDRGIEPVLGARAARLDTDNGKVTGVQLHDGTAIAATRAVILATGGFEWNDELMRSFLRGPVTATAGSPDNTGDGLVMAMDVGAKLANMHSAWWVPVIREPGREVFGAPAVHLVLAERTRPRSLMVNRTGRRFCNEAANYNALGGAFHQFDPNQFGYPNLPCWLIVDQTYRDRYEIASCRPADPTPEWIHTATTPAELAAEIGVDVEGLPATIERFNEHAATLTDPDFDRGTSAYDRFNGDQTRPGRQATLEPLDRPPYYAVEIESGTLGTNGGPKTDRRARVLHLDGGIITGLYAVGNAMAAATGMVYGGAGGTLGPAMTFGYIAGRDAAGRITA